MQKGFAPLFIIIGVLILLLLSGGVYYIVRVNSSKPVDEQSSTLTYTTLPPQQVQQPESPYPSSQPPRPEEYKSDNKVIYTQTGSIFSADGKTNKLLISTQGLIRELATSLDKQKLAYNYSANEETYYNYPKTGLAVLDLNNGTSKEIIPLKNTTVRYPVWSDNSKYLSVWINDGESSRIYDIDTNSVIVSADAVDKKIVVSPMVFVPTSQTKVSFIQNEELVEYDFTKQERTVIAINAVASRPVHEGPSLPNPPHYSADGNYVTFYNKNGDMVLLNKTDKSTKSLAKGYKSEFSGDFYPSGFIVGFTKENNLIYTVIGSEGYSYGDKPPVYVYSTANDGQTQDFPILSTSTDIGSLIFSPNFDKIVSHSVATGFGLTVYSPEGKVLKDCNNFDFRYSFYNWGGGPNYSSSLKVWSKDGKYILSQSGETLKVMNTETCGVSELSNNKFNTAIWLP